MNLAGSRDHGPGPVPGTGPGMGPEPFIPGHQALLIQRSCRQFKWAGGGVVGRQAQREVRPLEQFGEILGIARLDPAVAGHVDDAIGDQGLEHPGRGIQ